MKGIQKQTNKQTYKPPSKKLHFGAMLYHASLSLGISAFYFI